MPNWKKGGVAIYKEIQEYVKVNFGNTPKTCWIAHSKEIYGYTPQLICT